MNEYLTRRNGPVILVVDDSKVIHAVVDAILRDFEGSIVHAHDGSEGFRMARLIQPDILLTDALLPGLDGRDVVRLLKSDPATAGIRTIIMTALYKGQRYRAEAFREFLCDAYIEKPVSAAYLRAVIDEMLGKTPAEALAS
jgi:CheY-like chemotaxis protein